MHHYLSTIQSIHLSIPFNLSSIVYVCSVVVVLNLFVCLFVCLFYVIYLITVIEQQKCVYVCHVVLVVVLLLILCMFVPMYDVKKNNVDSNCLNLQKISFSVYWQGWLCPSLWQQRADSLR